MNWTLTNASDKPSEYQLISNEGQIISFKYSNSQHSIRMRVNEHYGVYVVNEGGFETNKFSVLNVYGSKIGSVTKGAWRETTGQLRLDELPNKINYQVNKEDAQIEITSKQLGTNTVKLTVVTSEQNYMLVLLVFAWMESVSVASLAEVA